MALECLQPLFEEQLEVIAEADALGVIIGDTPFTAAQILKSDEAAYRVEFSNWLNDHWVPEQLDLLSQILDVHANRARYEDLCATLANGELIPMIGSGMSVPSGLPMWPEFLRKMRHHSSLREEALEGLLSDSQYEEAAEALAASMPDRLFDERIEHDLRVGEADDIRGAVVFLPDLFGRLVLTTNLDNVLERLYEKHEKQFTDVLAGTHIATYRRLKGKSERMLLKLHGDCMTRDGRILSVDEYDAAYKAGAAVYEELAGIYKHVSILCLGCSLNSDRTVTLLGKVASADPGIPKHYALLKHPNDATALRGREHFLTERDVFPIWYDGEHDSSITALLVGMARHLGRV